MFNYVDPAGRNFLGNLLVEAEFRLKMQTEYESFARRPNSGFTWIEAFGELAGGQTPGSPTVPWKAFPLTATGSDREIDDDRLSFQDEYVEWRVERSGTKLAKVTFTTEFPEYFEAFAAVGFAALKSAIQDAIPGADPTEAEVFGAGFSSAAASAIGRARQFRQRLRDNPWNNGTKGILCLMQRFNTLGALFNLLTECGVPRAGGAPEGTCALVGGACGDGRNSDPVICTTAQTSVRDQKGFTLRDPAGIRLLELQGTWTVDGTVIDINNPAVNQGAWIVDRNGRRGVLTNIPKLKLDGDAIVTGTQLSRQLQVGADLLTAADAALPDWARITEETGSRGPS